MVYTDPLLSVVMPVYNERTTIDEIIRRVVAVPIRKELIVVDDGSTDGTGEILDTLLPLMNLFSRIIICGLIAEYSRTEPYAYRNLRSVLVSRIKMQGMIVFDWKDRYGEALAGLSARLAEGKLKYRESIVEGIDNAPAGLIALLKGENFGKQLVKLA